MDHRSGVRVRHRTAGGLQYANDIGATKWTATPSAFAYVRRRKWIRICKRKLDVSATAPTLRKRTPTAAAAIVVGTNKALSRVGPVGARARTRWNSDRKRLAGGHVVRRQVP